MNFLKKLFSPICLIISFLLLVYIFYKAEIYWAGTRDQYYLYYYIFSFILIIFSIFTFFISYKIKEYLIILSVSLITSLYMFEGYLSFKDTHYQSVKERKKIYEKNTGKKFDTRTRLEVLEDLKKTNKNVSMKVSPKHFLPNNNKLFALSSISNSKTVYCNENGYYFIYDSDRYGFNNPDEEWDSAEIEYLLVGDSTLQGACVNRPGDITSLLRNLSKKSALNLGYSGNGPLIEYASLREYLTPNVKKVLWVFYEDNDFLDLKEEIQNNILMSYYNDNDFSQNLKLKQKEIDKLVKEIQNIGVKGQKTKFFKLYKTRNKLIKKEKSKQIEAQPEFREILKKAKELTTNNNSKLYFVYIPSYNRYKLKNTIRDNNYMSVKKILKELNIPLIDIHEEVFKNEPNPFKFFPFEMFGHFNEEGYIKTAKVIYKLTKH